MNFALYSMCHCVTFGSSELFWPLCALRVPCVCVSGSASYVRLLCRQGDLHGPRADEADVVHGQSAVCPV